MKMTRTADEIVARIVQLFDDPADFFGFQRGDLIEYLPFEVAKQFFTEAVTADEWKPADTSSETIIAAILDYMPFAWDKANNCRGLSAARSINHMQAWLWMLGEEVAAKEIEEYDFYGKPQLRAICEHFGWDWKSWDDGDWRRNEAEDGSPAPETVDALPFLKAA